ncbi:DUF1345 domain-containing protein [Xylophilus sp. GW821-FHT01B05]
MGLRHHFTETTGPQRLAYAALIGVLVALAPLPLKPAAHGLLAWVCAGVVDLALAWQLARGFGVERIRARAQAQDQSAVVLFLAMVVALCASVAAIGTLLLQSHDLPPGQRSAHLMLALLALVVSWFWIHTLFAFRYAHLYYQHEAHAGHGASAKERANRAGLDFPGGQDPDYLDFLYYAVVVGMAAQVSDVQVTSRPMRRLTTVHGLISFAFNMLLLALGVNLAAAAF